MLETEHRLTAIEQTCDAIGASVKEVKENHLAHVQKSIDSLKEKQDRQTWLAIVTLVGIVVDLLLRMPRI